MDAYRVPIGFMMALERNTEALSRYGRLSQEQKQEVLDRARNVQTEKKMQDFVASLAYGIVE